MREFADSGLWREVLVVGAISWAVLRLVDEAPAVGALLVVGLIIATIREAKRRR